MKTGFIGLGNLGMAMARRLASSGTELVVWNRTREKIVDLDAEVADSPAAVVNRAEITVLNLFDSQAVREVLFSEKGILSGDCRNKIIIDTTTNHFSEVVTFYDALNREGAFYLESPVLGSIIPATQGTLTVLVSGERNAYERARAILEVIGKTLFYLEVPGLATKMKLINNLVLGSFMATISEAICFGESAGLDKERVIEILSAGAGNSNVMNAKREKLLREDFTTHFSSSLIYKDLHYMQDLARFMKRPLFTGSTVKELFGMTFRREMEKDDFSGIYRILRDL